MNSPSIRFRWKNLHLTDRCLLIFMLLLVAQAAYTLFVHEIGSGDSNSLDTVLRTTASAIFGYFISGGSQGKDGTQGEDTATQTATSRIGFQTAEETPTAHRTLSGDGETLATVTTPTAMPPTATVQTTSQQESIATHHQTVIVSTIGIIALVVLMFARNFTVLNTATIATLSQFRDFVSGSVGFLIGHANKSS